MTRLVPVLLDAVLIVVFAALGRRSHEEGLDLAGILRTAAPFLCGSAAGWLLASIALEHGPRTLTFGALVVVCAVVIGMLLRRVLGEGTAGSFIVVASVVLTAFLLGWRLVARFVGA
jgi:hypothetical protein